MKNITVTVDDDLYRRARVRAAELNTTVTALVREHLEHLTAGESDAERKRREQNELIVRIREEHAGFAASERLPRDLVHDRRAVR